MIGTVPLNLTVPGKFKPVNEDPNLQGLEYCVEKNGARYFRSGNQKYLRLGDYQRIDQIVRGLDSCGQTDSCLASFSYNCQHEYDLLTNKHKKRNKRLKGRSVEMDQNDNKSDAMKNSVDTKFQGSQQMLYLPIIMKAIQLDKKGRGGQNGMWQMCRQTKTKAKKCKNIV